MVLSDGTVLEAGDVILAAGYASRGIMNTVGLDLPMTDEIDCCLVTEMEPEMFPQMLGCADADFYGHQTKHGSFVFGAVDGQEIYMEEDHDTCNFAHAGTLGASCRAIEGYVPSLKNAKVIRSWTGWLDNTSDGVCVLGRPEETPGLILAAGFNGHGFGTAPAVGYMMAQIAAGEELRSSTFLRFATNVFISIETFASSKRCLFRTEPCLHEKCADTVFF